MTDPLPATSDGGVKPTRKAATRNKPTTAGKAGRWVAAGGAVGASLALVGAMSSAASHGNEAKAQPTEAVRRVVVMQQEPTAPSQIVIVLPDATASATQTPTPPQARPVVVTAPAKPTPPPPAPAAAPVTESSGS